MFDWLKARIRMVTGLAAYMTPLKKLDSDEDWAKFREIEEQAGIKRTEEEWEQHRRKMISVKDDLASPPDSIED